MKFLGSPGFLDGKIVGGAIYIFWYIFYSRNIYRMLDKL